MRDVIHLVYGTDDNYILPTMVSAASAAHLLKPGRRMVVHLFDAGVTDEHYKEFRQRVCALNHCVECMRHKLLPSMFEGFSAWRGSVVTYSRMFIAEILNDIDWAIYFDGDTLWTGDIDVLWNLRDETRIVLASVDPPTPEGTIRADAVWYEEHGIHMDTSEYLCMGLMLANLKKMREMSIPDKCREFLKKYPCPKFVDQTVLNYVCRGATAPLPPQWGVFSAWHGNADLTLDGAVHYVTDVPWRRDKINRLLSDIVLLWFDFCRNILHVDYLHVYVGPWGRLWRRCVFLFLKHNQWILKLHPYLKGHLRNTHGLTKAELDAIHARMLAGGCECRHLNMIFMQKWIRVLSYNNKGE